MKPTADSSPLVYLAGIAVAVVAAYATVRAAVIGLVSKNREITSDEGIKLRDQLLKERTDRESEMRELRAEILKLHALLDSKDETLSQMRTKRHETNNMLAQALAREVDLEHANAILTTRNEELTRKVTSLETRVSELEQRL